MPTTVTEFLFGLNPAFETLRANRRKVYGAYLNQANRNHPRMGKLTALLAERGIKAQWLEKGRLTDVCRTGEHQGVVLEVSPYPYVGPEQVLTHESVCLLDNLEDPHNVGAILRSAEVFGFKGVFLPSRGSPEIYPSVVKAAAGAAEFLDVCHSLTAVQATQKLLEAGFALVALDMHGKVDLTELPISAGARVCLVAGGEDRGVGQYVLNNAHHVVRLRQSGKVNSLNASVAAGIALHALAQMQRPNRTEEAKATSQQIAAK